MYWSVFLYLSDAFFRDLFCYRNKCSYDSSYNGTTIHPGTCNRKAASRGMWQQHTAWQGGNTWPSSSGGKIVSFWWPMTISLFRALPARLTYTFTQSTRPTNLNQCGPYAGHITSPWLRELDINSWQQQARQAFPGSLMVDWMTWRLRKTLKGNPSFYRRGCHMRNSMRPLSGGHSWARTE